MDERTREGLNFFLTVAVVLALFALLSTLMFPSWLHGSAVYVAVVVLTALGVAHALLSRGIVREWGLEPIPPRPDEERGGSGDAGVESEVPGTPKERVENRRTRE